MDILSILIGAAILLSVVAIVVAFRNSKKAGETPVQYVEQKIQHVFPKLAIVHETAAGATAPSVADQAVSGAVAASVVQAGTTAAVGSSLKAPFEPISAAMAMYRAQAAAGEPATSGTIEAYIDANAPDLVSKKASLRRLADGMPGINFANIVAMYRNAEASVLAKDPTIATSPVVDESTVVVAPAPFPVPAPVPVTWPQIINVGGINVKAGAPINPLWKPTQMAMIIAGAYSGTDGKPDPSKYVFEPSNGAVVGKPLRSDAGFPLGYAVAGGNVIGTPSVLYGELAFNTDAEVFDYIARTTQTPAQELAAAKAWEDANARMRTGQPAVPAAPVTVTSVPVTPAPAVGTINIPIEGA